MTAGLWMAGVPSGAAIEIVMFVCAARALLS